MKERRRIQVQGIVQGVGFRPFVYGLATRHSLTGWVLNDAAGVTIEVTGETAVLDIFTAALQTEAPPLALITQVTSEQLPPTYNGHTPHNFTIAASQNSSTSHTFISPDVATCDDCLQELFDPTDRRFRYPFINCTNCGPRFTIIEGVPYDRSLTTMASFQMCSRCQVEYDDPHNRRFHAQPNACPVCGPQLSLKRFGDSLPMMLENEEVIAQTQALLAQGLIVAIKGLGGYHLACDASNEEAVQRLRARKHRWDKPFALMAADVATVETICTLNTAERMLLTDRKRPIVLLNHKPEAPIAEAVAPHQRSLGVMLPYTPLHHLLLADSPCPLLVMTSGNRSDEPIAYRDETVEAQLGDIADVVWGHTRPIHIRCDDSVVRVINQRQQLVRRSRGFAPQPLSVGFEFTQPVLAVGAHLKNSFCLGQDHYAYLSHHIGDLDNLETLRSFREGIAHYKRLFDITPQIVAHDFHPDYLSTRYALEQNEMASIAVQHHHAHIASVMAEHQLTEFVIGVAFDGTGYGPDGTIWGGEFLVADLVSFERMAYLRPIPLLGGEQAVRQPWRITAAWLYQLYGAEWISWSLPFSQQVDDKVWTTLRQMMDHDLNCPLTSSMGRLFDAVAALLGVRHEVNYEGQAAIELEAIVDNSVADSYPFSLTWPELDPAPLFAALLADLRTAIAAPVIAAKFHNSIAELIAAVCTKLRQDKGLNHVALSGGVFQNAILLKRAAALLKEKGFEIFTNELVPPNDGGIALGQAAVAAQNLIEKCTLKRDACVRETVVSSIT